MYELMNCPDDEKPIILCMRPSLSFVKAVAIVDTLRLCTTNQGKVFTISIHDLNMKLQDRRVSIFAALARVQHFERIILLTSVSTVYL